MLVWMFQEKRKENRGILGTLGRIGSAYGSVWPAEREGGETAEGEGEAGDNRYQIRNVDRNTDILVLRRTRGRGWVESPWVTDQRTIVVICNHTVRSHVPS